MSDSFASVSEESKLTTNSGSYRTQEEVQTASYFTTAPSFGDVYQAFLFFCDKSSLDKKQVALGILFSTLLVFFSFATIVAWNRYSPIIQEFIIKENIEKTRLKTSEKQKKEE